MQAMTLKVTEEEMHAMEIFMLEFPSGIEELRKQKNMQAVADRQETVLSMLRNIEFYSE